MQVDFYQLTRDPAEKVVPPIAQRILDDGGRLIVVSGDADELGRISSTLWQWKPESFLANARAGGGSDAVQPILLSDSIDAINGARFILIADGQWREEAFGFDRAFYLFPPARTDDARAAWRMLADREGVERRYWKQDGGKWRQGP